jgi:hypothetical protein
MVNWENMKMTLCFFFVPKTYSTIYLYYGFRYRRFILYPLSSCREIHFYPLRLQTQTNPLVSPRFPLFFSDTWRWWSGRFTFLFRMGYGVYGWWGSYLLKLVVMLCGCAKAMWTILGCWVIVMACMYLDLNGPER